MASSLFRRLFPFLFSLILLTTVFSIFVPKVAAETPKERCQRETEAYNQLWKDTWRRAHPEEVQAGKEPPRPSPPYRCFGGPTIEEPGVTPPAVPAPGVGGSGGIPGGVAGTPGSVNGNTPPPGLLDEPPAAHPRQPATPPYLYEHTYTPADTNNPNSATNTLTHPSHTTDQGNGLNPAGNSLSAQGNGVNPKGIPQSSVPLARKENSVKRWWHKLTHTQVQHEEVRQELEVTNADDDPAKFGENREKGKQYPNPTESARIEKLNDLTKEERSACWHHISQCISAQQRGADRLAWSESEKYFPGNKGYTGADDKRDAARHCIWMGVSTAWGDESYARAIAEAHEDSDKASKDPTYARASRRMDEWNNETGIAVGLRHDNDTRAIIADCVTRARNATYISGADKHPNRIPPAKNNTKGNTMVFFEGPHRKR